MSARLQSEFAAVHEHLAAGLNALARLLLSLVIVGALLVGRGARRLRKHFYPYKCLDCGRSGHRECDGSRRELAALAAEMPLEREAAAMAAFAREIGERR